jgi:hypothetical protein
MDSLTMGNVKAAMRDVGAVSADLWQVAPDKLRVLDGFNVRVINDAYKARVRWIADSIKANGYYKNMPLAGYVAREGDADVIYITGGHRRHAAVLLAISEGVEIPTVPVVVSPRGTSIEDLTVELATGNDGEPLSAYEQAIVCKRLASFGWESKAIAQRLCYASAQYVDGLLSLAAAPLPVRKMVEENVVSATTAIAAIAKYGDQAHQQLLNALVKAAGGRVSPKHMPGHERKVALRKVAEPMHNALQRIHNDPGFVMLSGELQAAIGELLKGIPS